MAMMASGSGNGGGGRGAGGGGSTSTGSPFVIEHDDDSVLDNDFLDEDESMCFYIFSSLPRTFHSH